MKRVKLDFHDFPKGSKALLEKAARAALKETGARGGTVNFVMVSDGEIKKLNARYRKVNRITDIISFRLSKEPLSGDIYIASGRSKKQSKSAGNTWVEELCYLVLHGVLHLFDYTDYEPGPRKKMFALQDRLFGKVLKK